MIQLDDNGNPIVIHYGSKTYSPKKVGKIKNSNWVKPNGGLWTSPIGSEYGWKDWCEAEQFRDCIESESFKLQFIENVKLYKIDTLQDLKSLPLTSIPGMPRGMMDFPDFEMISKHYNGIWLTVNGQHETRFSHPLSLYGWDCESILILDSKCCKQLNSFCYI